MAGETNGYAPYKMPCPDRSVTSSTWDGLSDSDRTIFINRTGLNETYWSFLRARASKSLISKTDYVTNTNFKELLDAVAWAAWNTVSAADKWFKNIAKDNAPGGRMEALALAYLQIRKTQINTHKDYGLRYSEVTLYPLANGKAAEKQSSIDLEMAMRIARRHNGGSWWLSLSQMKSVDAHKYVKKIAGIWVFGLEGNYPALRCARKSELQGKSLSMMPLNLS
jgi:hypothetical protein